MNILKVMVNRLKKGVKAVVNKIVNFFKYIRDSIKRLFNRKNK